MFRDIVSSLSLSPAASSQLAFYWRRLKHEQLTRQLSAVMAIALVGIQVATMIAPPNAANASSPNDVIPGGIDVSSFNWPKDRAGHDSPAYPCNNHMSQWPQKRYLLYLLATNRYDLNSLLSQNGISTDDICSSSPHIISSNYDKWLSYGRVHYFDDDQELDAGQSKFYRRPLVEWGGNQGYPSLYGKLANGHHFAIMYQCGNLEVTQFPPNSPPAPTPAPTPPKTPEKPTPPVVVTTPTTPTAPAPQKPTTPEKPTPPPVVLPPNISLSKSALIIPAAAGPTRNASNAIAQPGDVVEYTLTTRNSGKGAAQNFVVSDDINDVLEYADVIDPRGGTVLNGSISWPKMTIGASSIQTESFQVRVKNPIPTTPTSISDPQSYDFKMDDVYGNRIRVNVAVPAPAQVAVASKQLPETGAGTDSLVVILLASAIAYFYFRNRQLVLEIDMLRGDHYGNGGPR